MASIGVILQLIRDLIPIILIFSFHHHLKTINLIYPNLFLIDFMLKIDLISIEYPLFFSILMCCLSQKSLICYWLNLVNFAINLSPFTNFLSVFKDPTLISYFALASMRL